MRQPASVLNNKVAKRFTPVVAWVVRYYEYDTNWLTP